MASLLIANLSGMVTGDLAHPYRDATSIYAEDGVIREVGSTKTDADTVIDAKGLLAAPGLIDTHVHPTFGDYTPTQHTVGWMHSYLHGGVTSLVSAGELHVPGLPLDQPDAKLFKYLAILAKRCADNLPQQGPRLHAGTMMLTTGMTEADFDELASEGIRNTKFIFYPYGQNDGEAEQYVQWCHDRDMVVKIHTGGVSRSGASRPAGARVITGIQPDVAGHIAGGPIGIAKEEMEAVVMETDAFLEICTGGSFRRAVELIEIAQRENALERVILGTDTPSGTGITPRAMLRNVALLTSLGGLSPEVAWCLATGNAARAHKLDGGFIQEGKQADILLMGRITGSVGQDAMDVFNSGDIPGISTVIVGGELVVRGRSEQTPPPETLAVIEKESR